MTSGPVILVVDPDASCRALAALLVEREVADAIVTSPSDTLALADAIVCPTDLAIVSGSAAWGTVTQIVQKLKERSPDAAIVVFADDAELMGGLLDSGLACDGVLRRGTAGYLALGPLAREVLDRRAVATARSAPAPGPQPVPSERGSAELRDVALVVSHDVCEPLQQIVRLVRRAEHAEGAVQSRTLQQVLDCAERASGMLERMVQYLTLGALDRAPGPVDLNACLNQALDNLRNTIDETGAEVRTVFLPMAMGEQDEFVHLFQNLVSNAITYRGRERPLLTISVEARGAQWLLGFRDNGIGIPPGATERIFELGKRLHTREEHRGHGVGLALCRRIVERHGGRIWGESRDGGGSTFYLLLPRVPAEVARPA